MTLIAYYIGQNIVAAGTPAEAVAVIERHEPPGKWREEDVRELSAARLEKPVHSGSPATVAEALAACRSAQLIRWDYPRQ